jgi:hypothetical protein
MRFQGNPTFEELIKNVIIKIRNNPSLTLDQYNTYLSSKPWYEQLVIRVFLYKLVLLLAQKYGVILTNYTESQVLLKVRNWICNANINLLKKVVFGYFIKL